MAKFIFIFSMLLRNNYGQGRPRGKADGLLASGWKLALGKFLTKNKQELQKLIERLEDFEFEGRTYRLILGIASSLGTPAADETSFLDDFPGFPDKATVGIRRTLTRTQDDGSSPFLSECLRVIGAGEDDDAGKITLLCMTCVEIEDGEVLISEERIFPLIFLMGNIDLIILAGQVLSKIISVANFAKLFHVKSGNQFYDSDVYELFTNKVKLTKLQALIRLATNRKGKGYPKMIDDVAMVTSLSARYGVVPTFLPDISVIEGMHEYTSKLMSVLPTQAMRLASQPPKQLIPRVVERKFDPSQLSYSSYESVQEDSPEELAIKRDRINRQAEENRLARIAREAEEKKEKPSHSVEESLESKDRTADRMNELEDQLSKGMKSEEIFPGYPILKDFPPVGESITLGGIPEPLLKFFTNKAYVNDRWFFGSDWTLRSSKDNPRFILLLTSAGPKVFLPKKKV